MTHHSTTHNSAWHVLLIFLKLGLTSFGGPIAHLGYFHTEFVTKRRWWTQSSYADLVALCQFLPGPASSQVGMAIGLSRAGYWGALAAWLGFTLPSTLALVGVALGLSHYGNALPVGVLQGLNTVAVAVVAQAVWAMTQNLCPDKPRVTIMAAACCIVLWLPVTGMQMVVIVCGGLWGLLLRMPASPPIMDPMHMPVGRLAGMVWLALFFVLLLGLPVLSLYVSAPWLTITEAFYRAGSLVFGGGHVVLALLQTEVVATGWVSHEAFIAGYGAAQAVPGPLFSFAAFLGASLHGEVTGWWGATLAIVAIFIPSFFLIAGTLAFWPTLRSHQRIQAALSGVNAAVVGVLLAALYDPLWTTAIRSSQDFVFVLIASLALMIWRLPPWLVVFGMAALAQMMTLWLA